MPDEVDGGLLDRFVRGDQDAFEWLFRQFQNDVYHWIHRIVRDRHAAEDVFVETFWRAYRGRARFDSSRSFGAWIRRIARNAALDYLRTVRPEDSRAISAESLSAPIGTDPAMAQSIALAFHRLPPKSRVSRAVQALRKKLARLGRGLTSRWPRSCS